MTRCCVRDSRSLIWCCGVWLRSRCHADVMLLMLLLTLTCHQLQQPPAMMLPMIHSKGLYSVSFVRFLMWILHHGVANMDIAVLYTAVTLATFPHNASAQAAALAADPIHTVSLAYRLGTAVPGRLLSDSTAVQQSTSTQICRHNCLRKTKHKNHVWWWARLPLCRTCCLEQSSSSSTQYKWRWFF